CNSRFRATSLFSCKPSEARRYYYSSGGQVPESSGGIAMVTRRGVQVSRPNGPLEFVERPIPEPGPGTLRIKVLACGVCHSDSLVKEGAFPGIQYPRVPGHEVAGVVDAIGAGVTGWTVGERVGVGWNGGYCGQSDHCRRGELFACVTG